MTETYEASYYKSIVDDMTVAKERVTEHRDLLLGELAAMMVERDDLRADNSRQAATIDRLRLHIQQGVEL